MKRIASTSGAMISAPRIRAEQMGHTVDVNENVDTITSINRRKEAVNALERALEAQWTLSDFVSDGGWL
jgi:hypothetical protein